MPEDIDEQRAIAHILGTLDDKIELNRRMNETLEAMARALFKSWFVDFDPVRAKAEGRDPGLPKPIADLFPDRFEDSELGEIPEGWEVKTFGDCCLRVSERASETYDGSAGSVSGLRQGTEGSDTTPDRFVREPRIIIGRKGASRWRSLQLATTIILRIDTAF